MDRVASFLVSAAGAPAAAMIEGLPVEDQFLLLCLPAIGQGHVLQQGAAPAASAAAAAAFVSSPMEEAHPELPKLLETLRRVETFYDSLGGILGYQEKSLSLVAGGTEGLTGGASSAKVCEPQILDPEPAEAPNP
jgi:hypothetical protein